MHNSRLGEPYLMVVNSAFYDCVNLGSVRMYHLRPGTGDQLERAVRGEIITFRARLKPDLKVRVSKVEPGSTTYVHFELLEKGTNE